MKGAEASSLGIGNNQGRVADEWREGTVIGGTEDAFEQLGGSCAPVGFNLCGGRLAHPGRPRQLGLCEGYALTCSTRRGRRVVTMKPAHVSIVVYAYTIGEVVAVCRPRCETGDPSCTLLFTKHVLVLTNRGGVTNIDIEVLAHIVCERVLEAFGMTLVPGPTTVGIVR